MPQTLPQNSVKDLPHVLTEKIRAQTLHYAKDFKSSWINLGKRLSSIWKDKLFYHWGYRQFEDYTEKELGIRKSLALKMIKAYDFLEHEEPSFLKKESFQTMQANKVPSYEAVDVLRMAKQNKELPKTDYSRLKSDVFQKGKEASEAKRDLTGFIKARNPVDPEKEREHRNQTAIRRLISALHAFRLEMESLKLIPHGIVLDAEKLLKRLKSEIDET